MENRIFYGSLNKIPLNLKRETGKENHERDKMLRLKITQPRHGHEEENRGIEVWSLFSESRLIIHYNSREGNPSLLG